MKIKEIEKKTFEELVLDTKITSDTLEKYLDKCLKKQLSNVELVPLRYRIFAYGFRMIQDGRNEDILETVENMLEKHGCEKLYARNLQEAVLMYAFNNRKAYSEWKVLNAYVCALPVETRKNDTDLFWLRTYIEQGSTAQNEVLVTKHLTQQVKKEVLAYCEDETFKMYLKNNLEKFSAVREKTRYYFCKYLYYMIEERIEDYRVNKGDRLSIALQKIGGDAMMTNDIDILQKEMVPSAYVRLQNVLTGISGLLRCQNNSEKTEEILQKATLCHAGIDALFTYFYFKEDTPVDWMDVLDNCDDQIDIDEMAACLREKYPRKYTESTDEDIAKQEMNKVKKSIAVREAVRDQRDEKIRDSRKKEERDPDIKFKTGRSGEKRVRAFINGSLDINRTTLICYLLFFGTKTRLPKEHAITRQRLDVILAECGFHKLDAAKEFDQFVLGFLDSEDPEMYIEEVKLNCAYKERNFYAHPLSAKRKKEDVSNAQENKKTLGSAALKQADTL